ncbi:hypothetical protein HJFPF1_05941 [Paramyrothecium foliicola]|nr:hypothetical protein HJFPF1_05941 [Paramyrothecium foliicola]
MPHSYFSHGALATSFIPGLFGLNMVLRPEASMASAHIPISTTGAEGRKSVRMLMRFCGVRNIAVCYLLLLNWFRGDAKQVGLGLMAGISMSAVDGLISKSHIGKGEWDHWTFVRILAGVSAGLLGYFS